MRSLIARTCCCIASVAVLSCASEDPRVSSTTFRPIDEESAPTFAEFEQRSRRVIDGRKLYVVEWDLPISSEEELRSYYDRHYGGNASDDESQGVGTPGRALESAVHITEDVEGDCPPDCIDDVWYGGKQRGLRYCVSTAFGGEHATMVALLDSTTRAWQTTSNLWFTYVPSADGSCSTTDPKPSSVDFKVAPWSSTNPPACAPLPVSGAFGCVSFTLTFNPNLTPAQYGAEWSTVLTHELGHVIGLAHEFTHPDSPSCPDDDEARALTVYDGQSVMGYPNGVAGCGLGVGPTVSVLDSMGARLLYGVQPGMLVASAW